jgi:plasmid maintenance system antidote protein VapI
MKRPLMYAGVGCVSRLARAFNTTPAYWMNMQANYDMSVASKVVDVSGIEPLFAV